MNWKSTLLATCASCALFTAACGNKSASHGYRVYVSNEADSTLDVFDRESGALIKKVPLSNHPNNIAVTKNGDRILVGIARGPGAVDVIDAKTLTRTKSILVKGRLHNIYVTPDGKHLITGSIPGKLMTVIDLEREVPVWELPFDLGVRPMTIEAGPWIPSAWGGTGAGSFSRTKSRPPSRSTW
jgi:DNA-binding beta-propeller fold protein YncE